MLLFKDFESMRAHTHVHACACAHTHIHIEGVAEKQSKGSPMQA